MSSSYPTIPVLAAIALLAGALQIVATIVLGLAPLPRLSAIAAEGATYYLLMAAAALLGGIVVWFLRRRPMIAVGLLLVWQLAVYWPLRTHISGLGLAFHGEYMLHHFTGLVAAAVCIAIGTDWLRSPDLGRGRWIPGGLAVLGPMILIATHVLEQPALRALAPPELERVGTAMVLLSWLTAVPGLWTHLTPSRLRLLAVLLVLPLLLRVALAGLDGLHGASIPDTGRPWLMGTVVVTGLATLVLFRPSVSRGARLAVTVFSGLATVLLYLFYTHGFGELEASLGGLAQSLLAFSLPYPHYVTPWKLWVVMLGLFALFNAAYLGLMGAQHRSRGLSLCLLVVTGLGLSTPSLVLMTGAAGLIWIDSLRDPPSPTERSTLPSRPIRSILEDCARRIQAPKVVALDDSERSLLAIRGDVNAIPVDLRARPISHRGWNITLTVGVMGRRPPQLRLIPEPGPHGHRPPHALGRSHLARGQVRQLEHLDDRLFDAVVPFPTAEVELWDAGVRVRLGSDLAALDAHRLASLIDALADALVDQRS